MRNIFRYKYTGTVLAASLMISASFTSCKKYTELTPKDVLSIPSAFADSANIETTLNGVYNAAAVGSYNDGAGRGYPFGGAAIQQSDMRGEDMLNLATFYEITYKSTITTTTANNVHMWLNLYALVNQANVFIEGAKKAEKAGLISSGKELQMEAEARFLRALAHHELLLNFCRPYADGNGSKPGIPYRDVAIDDPSKIEEALKVGRGTVAEAYTKVLADLDFVEQNGAGTNVNKANKGAAIALKTRIKLHMADYAGVIAEATKLGTDKAVPTSPLNGYVLAAAPSDPFLTASKESIFSIANSTLANGGTNGALAPMYGPADLGGRGLVALSPNLFNQAWWVADDIRRTTLTYKSTDGKTYSYKFRDYVNKADNSPIIRYAEVVLNAAEAYARTGNDAQAFILLNNVRNRALPATSTNRFTTAPADLVLAILQERRIEFQGEGRRWADIHRLAFDTKYGFKGVPAKIDPASGFTGTAADYKAASGQLLPTNVAAVPYDDYRYLWPFPATEVAANPTLKAQQNPGYE
ncbi:RagB/SusD family nutrient uptake outer membrane protein [Chitinophaga sp. sic0106]|uniref:RagB/SusD family nutrient uptake outer membrane protein n=1 Tax=Chitinophaga sp. sic0106 TaxID=2854785 RepID=UPI001C481653|nr:RagB/SusD family nutrient uptake outer membrane protein [Chitinophaga sp. sic0106]MBV7533665.1 RagB/SusD family nutrient uptake outer membrane protein [Chitinophaga sp. sic0106]